MTHSRKLRCAPCGTSRSPAVAPCAIIFGMEKYAFRQLAGYLDELRLQEGWLAVFDEDKAKPWEEKLYTRDVSFGGKTIHVIGL